MSKYDGLHRRLRARWHPRVQTGRITCTRYGHPLFPHCPGLIAPGTPWDLGHDDTQPNAWTGPEHQACNRRAGALKQQGLLSEQRPRSRDW